MAAYAALVSLLNIIHDIQHHYSPPISLHIQHLQSLTQILTSLLGFLETYKSPVADGDESDPLEMRVADAAYAVEDVIESHIVDKIHRTTSTPTHRRQTNRIFNCFRPPRKPENEKIKDIKFCQDLHRLIEEMDLIKQIAMKNDAEDVVAVHDEDVSASADLLTPSSTTTSNAMVCSDAIMLEIMEKLTRGRLDRQVIPIVGMGGIGKTTLASNIYTRPLIKEYFDVCAWATISQRYNMREILCEVLSQATNSNKNVVSNLSEDELGSALYKYLYGRRFLIVMDDMWSIDAWERIQHYFPNNGNGSRILVTTRLSDVGSQLNAAYRLQMEFLDEVSSWDLLSKTVFGERSNCPQGLEKIGKKILESCGGLPLSIVVVGGILKRMEQSERCWESIRNNLTSVVNLENDKHCLRLLKLSYIHLPVYLKPCFLYMGVFKEDAEIRVSILINLWVSEGFIKPMNDRSSETIAMGYLKDLVDRNLIIIHRLGSTGNIKSCKVHHLLRDLCLKEGQRDGFHHVLGRCSSTQGINRKCRRVVLTTNTSKDKVAVDLKSMRHARSVLCEYGEVLPCKKFELLRIFQAYKLGFYIDLRYENYVAFPYVNLRHLAVVVGNTSSFFSSLSLFWNFQTLIIWCPNECNAPTEIWKMPQFRHVEFTKSKLRLPDPPEGKDDDVVIMKNLGVLKGVENFKCSEEVVKRIPNIKKLKVRYYGQLKGSKQIDSYCVANIKFLCKLESLSVLCSLDNTHTPHMHKLSFPQSLKKLNLNMNDEFDWEVALEKIGSLPCLEKLKLWGGWFRRGKWEIVEGQFPELKHLGIVWCDGLKKWTVEGSSVLPRLEQLRLIGLKELEEIPHEIGNIATLQKIYLYGCSESAVKSMEAMVEEQVELQGEQLPFRVDVYFDHKRHLQIQRGSWKI